MLLYINLNNNRAGAAAVIRNKNNQIIKISKQRISGHVSSLQAELCAIALDLTESKNIKNIGKIIHTDSLNSILDIQKTEPKENVELIKTIHKLIDIHHKNGNHITLNYVPSHIGLVGNEQADKAAKEALTHNETEINIKPEFSALKNKLKTHLFKKNTIGNPFRHIQITDSVLHYHIATENTPKYTAPNRFMEVANFRLKLGYRTYNNLVKTVSLCPQFLEITENMLIHYLAGCKKLKEFYHKVSTDPSDAAANLNHLLKNRTLLDRMIKTYNPPR